MTIPESIQSDDAVRYPSLESLRAAHTELLKAFRKEGNTAEIIANIELFIRRGKATGALLDSDADRWTAQNQLDYWSTHLYHPGYEPPDATLDEFDPQLAPELDDSLCPYMGLDAFREGNESVFFGRERLVHELIDGLKITRFLPVLGSSGSGKSSLVRAGFVPELKKGALTGSEEWHYFPPMVPGSSPLLNLARLVAPLNSTAAHLNFVAGAFRESPEYLVQAITEGTSNNVVLVIDQFEEIFTLCTDEIDRNRFVENLLALCRVPEAEHRVIITMRTDFETSIARLPNLQAIFEQHAMRVTPLTASELRQSIESPAALIGLKFEQGVVDALLNDILGEPAALPLLQFTLLKLWENRERNRVTWETYRKLGGGRQALARSADDFYNGLIPEEQVTMRRILLKMVRPGEGLEVTSNRIERKALHQKAEASDRIDRVLEKLIQERLVRISEGDTDMEDQVEIAHEALVRNWPRLVEWLEEERVALRQRQRLTTAAEEWQRLNGATAALWRRELLDEALRYDDLNELERKFVRASKARQERSRRFWAYGVAAIMTVLTLATGISTVAFNTARANQKIAEEERARAVTQQEIAEEERARAVAQQKVAEENANIALANSLAIQAQRVVEARSSNQMAGVLLAIHALNKSESVKEALFLLQNFSFSSEVARVTHNETINAIAFSPDGKYFVSASNDSTARVWEATTGREIASTSHFDWVNAVAFSPDGEYVVSGSWDGTARVWEAHTGQEIASMLHDGSVNTVAFSPDGRYVLSGSWDGTARLWDVESEEEIARIQHETGGTVESVAFSPDGKYFASGGCDFYEADGICSQGAIHIANASTGEKLFIGEHDTTVNAIAFSPDGKYVVSGSNDQIAQVWEVKTGRKIASMIHDDAVYAVAFSPNGRYVGSGSGDRTARLWEAETGIEIARMAYDDLVNAIVFSPDGKYVLSGSGDRTARLWDLTGKEIARMSHDDWVTDVAFSPDGKHMVSASADRTARVWVVLENGDIARMTHADTVNVVAFSPDEKYVVSGSYDGSARVWGIETGEEIIRLSHGGSVNAVAFSPDGKYILTGSGDSTARIWDLTGNEIARISHDDDWVSSVAFSPDGKYAASAGVDNSIRIYEIATGREIPPLKHNDDINDVAFSPDGKFVVSGSSDRTARVWEIATRREVASMLHGDWVYSVAFSPDGKYVASVSSDGTARVWEAATGREIARMTHDDWVYSVAFSPDGKYVVSGSYDRTARVWEAETGREIARVTHEDSVYSVAFSPDGKHVLSGSGDSTARLWEADTGEEIARIPSNNYVLSVAFSPDGKYIASGSGDRTARVRIWQTEGLIENICASLPRNLTLSEWNQYVNEESFPYEQSCPNLPIHPTVVAKAVEDALSVTDHANRVQLAIEEADNLMDGGSDQASDFVKEVITQQITALSSQNLNESNLERYFNRLEDAKTIGLDVEIDSRILIEIAREALQNQSDPDRLDTAIGNVTELLEIHSSTGSSEKKAVEIVKEAIESLVQDSDWKSGDLAYNFELLEDAKELGVEITSATRLNNICWFGSIRGYAKEVLPYCEQANILSPDDPGFRDSRGLARALTGNERGAIEDFQYFIDYGDYDETWIQQRKDWIVALQNGKNPFTPDELETLMEQ